MLLLITSSVSESDSFHRYCRLVILFHLLVAVFILKKNKVSAKTLAERQQRRQDIKEYRQSKLRESKLQQSKLGVVQGADGVNEQLQVYPCVMIAVLSFVQDNQ